MLRVYSCRLVYIDLLGVDHFSDQRTVISLLSLIPAELLFQHLNLPAKCLIFLKFLKVLLIHLLVLDKHLLVMIIDLLLRWLLIILGLAAHERNVIDEVLRDVGLSDALEEGLDGGLLDVLKVVAVDRQLRGLRTAVVSTVDQESAGRRRNEVRLRGIAVSEVRFLPTVLDAQRVDVFGLIEFLSC